MLQVQECCSGLLLSRKESLRAVPLGAPRTLISTSSLPSRLKCTPCQGQIKKKGFSIFNQQMVISFYLCSFFITHICRRDSPLYWICACCYVLIVFIRRELGQFPLISIIVIIIHPIIYNCKDFAVHGTFF